MTVASSASIVAEAMVRVRGAVMTKRSLAAYSLSARTRSIVEPGEVHVAAEKEVSR
jgi:hypothetical protein